MNRKRKQEETSDAGGVNYESSGTNVICKYCGEEFQDLESKHFHSELVHKDKYVHQCSQCSFKTQGLHAYVSHCAKEHGETLPARPTSGQKVKRSYQRKVTVTQRQSSFNGSLLHQKLNYISGERDQRDMHAAMNEFRAKIKTIMENYEQNKGPSKCYLSLVPHFVKYDQNGDIIEHQRPYFNSSTSYITNVKLEFQHFYDQAIHKIWNVMDL